MPAVPANSLSEILKPGTPIHGDILDRLKRRRDMSRKDMSQRYDSWKKVEDSFRAYMPSSDADTLRKSAREAGRPQYTTLVIPYDYAVLMTAHTYYTSVFLSRDPVMQYQGRHGESQQQEMAIEALIAYQMSRGENMVAMYNWLLDPGKYGIGILGHYWDEEMVTSSQIINVDAQAMGVTMSGKKKRQVRTQTVPGYHGHKLYNIRPQDWFPDTRVPINAFQRGEFCARYAELGYEDMKDMEAAGAYMNVNEAQGIFQLRMNRELGSSQNTLPNAQSIDLAYIYEADLKGPGFIPVIEMYIKIRPSDWKLGSRSEREMWMFTFTDDVILQAAPCGNLSGKFPMAVLEYEPGSYYLFNRSLMEIMRPLSETMTWLINTHFYNVRKTLNGEYLVDPSKVIMSDFDNPNPGRAIRLRSGAYGNSLDTVLKQLPVANVTQTHIQDSQLVGDMIQRVSGVVDNVMGMVNNGGRKTATEVRTSSSFAMNRLKTNVEYFSAMGMAPLGEQLLINSQQMYDLERKYRIVGDNLQPGGDKYINVGPADLVGMYDFTPVDGSMPIDRFAQASLWQQLFAGMRGMPQVAQQYDLVQMFAFVAKLGGIKNIDRFKIQIAPQGQMENQTQQGNVIPLNSPKVPGMGTGGAGVSANGV